MRKSPVLASLLAAACQTDGEPVPLEDFSTALSSAYCERTFECYSTAEIAEMWNPDFPDARSCTLHITEALDEALLDVYRSVYAGRLHYDGAAATRCLSTIHAASCWEIRLGIDIVMEQCDPAFE